MRSAWLVLTLALGACRGCTAPAPAAPDAGIEPFRERARVPAIAWAAVTRDRGIDGAVGFADVEDTQPATATTPFQAASIAKTIIATCVMQLVEQQRMSLDANVSSYVGFPPRVPITLRHLLTHTSSIVDREETAAPGNVGLGDFLERYLDAGVFLDAGPGTTMAYSNVGPSLAALAVERVAGVRFADYAKAHVFEPLAMRARFGSGAGATPYAWQGGSFVRRAPPNHALYPVVDLFASARDLGRFARAILRGGELDGARILTSASVAEMLRIHLDAAPEDGLGWQARIFGSHHVFGHEGEDLGASTGLYLDLVNGRGAVVLANGDAFHIDDPSRAKALGDLVEKLLDDE